MKQLMPAALAILMPFVFKAIQVLRDKKLQFKKMNEQLRQRKPTER